MMNRKERRESERAAKKTQANKHNKQAGASVKPELEFGALMKKLATLSENELFKIIRDSFNELRDGSKLKMAEHFAKYPFWGALDIKNKVYDALKNRARVIRKHHDDFVWLYERLADEHSKNVLIGILSNWVFIDSKTIRKYKELEHPEYFDPDVFPRRPDEVFVDVGAYTGDSAISFINTYQSYKRVYCYEITPASFQEMQKNLAGLPNIDLRQKAAGSAAGTMYLEENFDGEASGNMVQRQGEIAVEVVRLDEDITEPVTFIKMDIEGAEQDALRGCEGLIRKYHPKLAICTYHGYEDIFAIPRLIDEIEPGYTFYMRHHSGNLVPTEFSLLAVWDETDMTADGNEFAQSPLLTGLNEADAEYLRGVVDAVLQNDLQAALDEVLRLLENEIPDEHMESYVMLAYEICAAAKYEEGRLFFKKHRAQLFISGNRIDEAKAEIDELDELLPGDEDIRILREQITDY